MGDFDFGSWGSKPDNRYTRALKGQGFQPPTRESPFRNPPGWYGGAARQTGGMIMVREWGTVPGENTPHLAREKHRRYEYEVAYGERAGASIARYEWNPSSGSYEWDGVVDEISVSENTDEAKARAAKRLMQRHSDKTR